MDRVGNQTTEQTSTNNKSYRSDILLDCGIISDICVLRRQDDIVRYHRGEILEIISVNYCVVRPIELHTTDGIEKRSIPNGGIFRALYHDRFGIIASAFMFELQQSGIMRCFKANVAFIAVVECSVVDGVV